MTELKAVVGGDEAYDRIHRDIAKKIRHDLKRVVDRRPQDVVFAQGCYDVLMRDIPNMITDASIRACTLEKAYESAIGKIVTLQLQIEILQDRLAKLEERQAVTTDTIDGSTKDYDDPGTVVRLRDVAAA
jgi:hypothetical protein